MTATVTPLEQALHDAGLTLDDTTMQILATAAAHTLAAKHRPLPVYGPCDRCGQVPTLGACLPVRGDRRPRDTPVPLRPSGMCPNCDPAEETSP